MGHQTPGTSDIVRPFDPPARNRFLQPPPAELRLDAKAAGNARRALTACRKAVASAPAAAVAIATLVEARQSSRIENVPDEPTPAGADRASRLYRLLARRDLTPADIPDAHRSLWDDIPLDDIPFPGQWRPVPVRVGNYFPPPPGNVPELMTQLINWLQQPTSRVQDRLFQAVYGHIWFESVHPFADGNGRVGRWLISRLLDTPASVSRSIFRRRQDYYRALNRAEWDHYQAFMLDCIAEAAWETASDLRHYAPDRAPAAAVAELGDRRYPPQRRAPPLTLEQQMIHDLIQKQYLNQL